MRAILQKAPTMAVIITITVTISLIRFGMTIAAIQGTIAIMRKTQKTTTQQTMETQTTIPKPTKQTARFKA